MCAISSGKIQCVSVCVSVSVCVCVRAGPRAYAAIYKRPVHRLASDLQPILCSYQRGARGISRTVLLFPFFPPLTLTVLCCILSPLHYHPLHPHPHFIYVHIKPPPDGLPPQRVNHP